MLKVVPAEYKRAYELTFLSNEENVENIHGEMIKRIFISMDSGIKRFFLIRQPKKTQSKYKCLIYYHGSRGTAWEQVLKITTFHINPLYDDFYLVYGQCDIQNITEPFIHSAYNHPCFGEIYWEIRDFTPGFSEDLEYTKLLVEKLRNDHTDIEDIYFIGHSNGGVFALLMALYLPNAFKGIVSHQGGLGFDPLYYLPFEILDDLKEDETPKQRVPILLYTGEFDIHREVCEQAALLFRNEGFHRVDLFIEEGATHHYDPSCEKYLYDWLLSC
jgi:predicted esterase